MIEVGVKIYGLRLIEKVNGARKQQEKCLKKAENDIECELISDGRT